MLKWKILAVLGLTFSVAGIIWGYAPEKRAVGFFELRVYSAQPGKRDALAARFVNRTAAVFARHGITNVGYWIPQQSNLELGVSAESTFIYIRGYPSKEALRNSCLSNLLWWSSNAEEKFAGPAGADGKSGVAGSDGTSGAQGTLWNCSSGGILRADHRQSFAL
jgi:NIPSNAP